MTNSEVAAELLNIVVAEIKFLEFLIAAEDIPGKIKVILDRRKIALDQQLRKLLTADLVKHQ